VILTEKISKISPKFYLKPMNSYDFFDYCVFWGQYFENTIENHGVSTKTIRELRVHMGALLAIKGIL
jgi:hypothetical protein